MELVNENFHSIAVKNNDGELQSIAPGEVVNADGGFADRLSNTNGVTSASSSAKKAWQERSAPETVTASAPTPGQKLNEAVLELRRAAGNLLAATNQIVVGDDQAPHGPGSGTITTVQAVNDPEHFGTHSAAHLDKVEGTGNADDKVGGIARPSSAEVHNSQVERHEEVGDVAARLAALHGGEPSDGDGDEYDDLSGDELDAELEARGLAKTGRVAEKRQRLRDDDAEGGASDEDADE